MKSCALNRRGMPYWALSTSLLLSGCLADNGPVSVDVDPLKPLPDAEVALNRFKRANAKTPHLFMVAKDVIEMKVARCQLTYDQRLVEDVIQNSVVFAAGADVVSVSSHSYEAFKQALEQTVNCSDNEQLWLESANSLFLSNRTKTT